MFRFTIYILALAFIASTSTAAWEGEYKYTDACNLRPLFFEPKCLKTEKAEDCFICYHERVKASECPDDDVPDCDAILKCIQQLEFNCHFPIVGN
jgi:hypothetical protein